MSKCIFHPEQEAIATIRVHDKKHDMERKVRICSQCAREYDKEENDIPDDIEVIQNE